MKICFDISSNLALVLAMNPAGSYGKFHCAKHWKAWMEGIRSQK